MDNSVEEDYETMENYNRFFNMFNFNLSMLLNRLVKIRKINPLDSNNEVEWFTYFDCIITQLRAMFIENERYKNNYTYQNFLTLYGKNDIVTKINNFLETPFIDESTLDSKGEILSIKNAIKFIADKFICHYENTSLEELARQELISNTLSNLSNNSTNNLDVILTRIFTMIEFRK
ncbi:MAG TPA: hypothetical protein PK514_13470 [Spirochaetota bacterium]|nr:hypothetical protein [Spirochaetota bacterium]